MDRFRLLFVLLVFSFLFLFIPKAVSAASCYVCTSDSSCQTAPAPVNFQCSGQSQNCRNVGCNFESGNSGWCDYFTTQSQCIGADSFGCNMHSASVPGRCYIAPACTGDGACKGSAACCSGSSYSDSTCGSGTRCGTPSSPPSSGGNCPCSNWCTGSCPGGYSQTNYCGGSCSPGLVACIPSSACGGGGGGGGGGIPKNTCGQACGSDSECNNPSAAGVTTACRGGVCVNLACWSSGGTTVPGANCDCQGSPQCGMPCGASVGINCQNSSICTYVNAPGGNCGAPGPNDTYCVGTFDATHTANANLNRFTCNGGGNSYLKNISTGQTTNFSASDILSTCACRVPDSVSNPLLLYQTTTPLDGATVNAVSDIDSPLQDASSGYWSKLRSYTVSFVWGNITGGYGHSGPTGYEDGVSGTSYDIEVVPENGDCTSPAAYCLYNTTIRYQTFAFAPKVNQYKARIRNYNARCNLAGPWTNWNHFTVTGLPPSGGVYLDDKLYSVYDFTSNSCTTPQTTFPYSDMPGKKAPSKLEIVDAPGLLGSYYNSYINGNGPSGGQTYSSNGITYFGGTARTRYDTGYPTGLDGPNYYGMGARTYHGTLNTPGMSDGPGAVIWTGKIRPTSTNNYCFGASVDRMDDGTQGYRVTVGSSLVVNAWPIYWNGIGNIVPLNTYEWPPDGCITLTAAGTYPIKIEWFKPSYNSTLFLNQGAPFWQSDSIGLNGNVWQAGTSGPTSSLNLFQPGNGSTVTVTQGSTSNTDGVSSGYFYSSEDVNGGATVTLNPGDSSYSCVCPAGCTYSGVNSRIYARDFYVTKMTSAWFQAIGGNLVTNGTITSKVPSGVKVILDGAGGFPANALYGGSISPTGTNISSKGWNAKTTYQAKTFDYAYFNSIIPGSATLNMLGGVVGNNDFNNVGNPTTGYYWYKANGDLTISGDVNVGGNRKVILFVDGNLNINGKINIASKGKGFFMAIVRGNISVAGTVTAAGPALEGIFVTTGSFDTGVGNTQLYVRGSVVAYGGVTMRRNLMSNNATAPGEKYEYAPDLIMLFPPDLAYSRKIFNEVIP